MTWQPSDETTLRDLTLGQLEDALCEREPSHWQDWRDWAHDCHSVSLAIVQSDLFEQARVARGSCFGVGGQHSWVVLGDDCYDPRAPILDATLWSYDDQAEILWRGPWGPPGLHHPHGQGHFLAGPPPYPEGGEPIRLRDAGRLSFGAARFLQMVGPLDAMGWARLGKLPVQGWPAREIIEAMLDTPALKALVPIDIVGMVTDRNPDGLYLREQDAS